MNFTYEPLTKKQIEDVHQATLDVLEKCGVEMCDERAHEIFKKHGATVEGNIIKIPPKVVEDCMKLAPRSFIPVSYTHLDVYKRQVAISEYQNKSTMMRKLRSLEFTREIVPFHEF